MEFKFTRGSWESEGVVEYNLEMKNIWIKPEKTNKLEFKILEWDDRSEE
jgi:hypothetical protein